MVTRRDCLGGAGVVAAALAGCAGLGSSGDGGDATFPTTTAGLSFSSPAFPAGSAVPTRYTCDGENVSPPLTVGGVPDEAASLAVVVDDPDAPSETPFVHWVLWNVASARTSIPAAVSRGETALDGARQGANDAGSVGYTGPCPPADDGAHTYRFTCLALEGTLDVEAGATKATVLEAARDAVVAGARFTGEFDR